MNGGEKLFFFPEMMCLHSCCFSLLNMQARGFRLPGLSVMSLKELHYRGIFYTSFSQERKPRHSAWEWTSQKKSLYLTSHVLAGVSSSFSILSNWFEDLNLLRVQPHTAFCSTHICSACQWLPKRGTPFSCSLSVIIFFSAVSLAVELMIM